jgi:MFS family permease
MREPLTPLRRNRDFILLWTGQAVSTLGSRVTWVAFPLLVLATTGSAAKAGVVGFANTVPRLALGLFAGVAADRWNRRRLMVVSDLVRGGALATLALATWTGHLTFAHIAVVALVDGTFTVLFQPAETAALSRVVPSVQLPVALAQNEARSYAAFLAGPSIGGLLFSIRRFLPFLVDAVSYGVSAVTLLFLRTPLQAERVPATDRPRPLAEVSEGLRWLIAQPFLRVCAALVAGSNLISNTLGIFVIVLARQHGASAGATGLILSIGAAGGLLGAATAAWLQRRLAARLVVVGFCWAWTAVIPLLAISPRPIALGLVLGALLSVSPVWNAVVGAYQIALVPDRLQGRVSSAFALLALGGVPLGSLLGGVLVSTLGYRPTVTALTAAMAALGIAATASSALRSPPDLSAAAEASENA